VKILDFGIAKMSAESSSLTASDTLLGTPAYMAPEQTDSRGPPITLRADLYALGLIAFRLLVGRTYWRDGSLAQLLAQILAEPMPPASERGSKLDPLEGPW
jgi:serine/threonine-protein kinase